MGCPGGGETKTGLGLRQLLGDFKEFCAFSVGHDFVIYKKGTDEMPS